eukprot:TRINITY_DN14453_c0_g1_i1.p1 TRINITY_DN14453_c0_g1~~TRINITY_DN14453_c0_g1_i1.p1  ORF type:complete len:157 (+),score=41.06 TRINITY_DN14453_c0_g1_i1:119-589(+)
MKHQIAFRKLGRNSAHRMALLRNMATSLFTHGKIITTVPKAKELRRIADKLVTHAKIGNLLHRRKIGDFLRTKQAITNLCQKYSYHARDRPGGYTRITLLGKRHSDNSEMCSIELVMESIEQGRRKKAFVKQIKKEKIEFKNTFYRRVDFRKGIYP